METLKDYTVLYKALGDETWQRFECAAEDGEHAEEQCFNAYPDCIVLRVERGNKRTYYINPPEKCDICEKPLKDIMYDGVTVFGPWANMCPKCHTQKGRGLGVGVGQRYEKQRDGRWLKTQ